MSTGCNMRGKTYCFALNAWASFGGETGGHVPLTFLRVGDTISNVPPTFFEHVCVSPQKSYILVNFD